MKKICIGYQLYSAREEAAKDLYSVLKQLKEMGYDGVEFAGFYGYTPEKISCLLKETGLIAISSHVPYAKMVDDMYAVISEHLKIGCKYIVVPYLEDGLRPGQAGFAEVIRNIYRFGMLCKEAGITLLYHNHDFEFSRVSDMYGLDFLYSSIPADILSTEIDTCWVKYSGIDPTAYILQYSGRAPIIHLKDYVGQKDNVQPYALIKEDGSDDGTNAAKTSFQFRPVGCGCQDIAAIIKAGKNAGAVYFVVEQDQWYNQNPLEAAKVSIDNIIGLGLL